MAWFICGQKKKKSLESNSIMYFFGRSRREEISGRLIMRSVLPFFSCIYSFLGICSFR